MRNERRMSGSERGDEKPAAAKQLGAHRLLYVYVYFRKGWTEDASYGRKPAKVRFHLVARSCRCCWRASTGGDPCVPPSRS